MNSNYTYGYARVSTQQQELIRQLDMLKQYNCTVPKGAHMRKEGFEKN